MSGDPTMEAAAGRGGRGERSRSGGAGPELADRAADRRRLRQRRGLRARARPQRRPPRGDRARRARLPAADGVPHPRLSAVSTARDGGSATRRAPQDCNVPEPSATPSRISTSPTSAAAVICSSRKQRPSDERDARHEIRDEAEPAGAEERDHAEQDQLRERRAEERQQRAASRSRRPWASTSEAARSRAAAG